MLRLVDLFVIASGLQFFVASTLVYAGWLGPAVLFLSFFMPLLVVPGVWGRAQIERVLIALAVASLAGLPNSNGDIFATLDPSAGLSGLNPFTLAALLFALARMLQAKRPQLDLWLMAAVPVVGALVSFFAFDGARVFVLSEFLKYLAFLCFAFYAAKIPFKRRLIHELVPRLFGMTLLVGALLYELFGFGYYYGGMSYMFAPASIMIIPVMVLFGVERKYGVLLLVVAILLALGFVQASAKLIVLILVAMGAMVFRRAGPLGLSAVIIALVPLLVLAFDYMPDGVRHKTMTALWLVSGQFEVLGSLFFFTSAGNLLAEAIAVIETLQQRLFLPVGPGFGLSDHLGLLSLANEFAYPESAFRTGVFYPLHLGLFYLCLWYGVALPLARPALSALVFAAIFCLTGMTYKPLLFVAVLVSPAASMAMRKPHHASKRTRTNADVKATSPPQVFPSLDTR